MTQANLILKSESAVVSQEIAVTVLDEKSHGVDVRANESVDALDIEDGDEMFCPWHHVYRIVW